MATEHDQAIARNFQRLRGNITMDELAMRMRQVGHKWSRTTVYSIEHNERRLQASEAYDFLSVIGRDPDEDLPLLYRQIPRTPVEKAEREVSSLAGKLAADWNAYLLARSMHERIIDREKKRRTSRMNAPASHAGSRTTWTRLSAARYGTGNRAISGPQGERQESGTLSLRGDLGNAPIMTGKAKRKERSMFMKKQFNTEIDHETAQRVRDKCRELDIRIGHFIRCIIVPDDADALYDGDDLDFGDVPRAIPVHSGGNANDDLLSARMSEAEHEVLTRCAIKGELTRSELMRLLVAQALENPELGVITDRSDWEIELACGSSSMRYVTRRADQNRRHTSK